MSISILNRGASGGLKPELTVIAPVGSTIDILQGGIIINTYILGADETEHTFRVKVGTYTVTGTLGEETNSKEVLIDVVAQYVVKLDYKLWLYNYGDECEDVTGGWTPVKFRGGLSALVREKREDHLYAYGTTNSSYGSLYGFSTVNKIDVTDYTKMKVLSSGSADNVTRVSFALAIVNNDASFNTTYDYPQVIAERDFNSYVDNPPENWREIDISDVVGEAYVQFTCLSSGSGTTRHISVYAVALE